MSRESDRWLNRMTLIGNTDKRGTAWHYRAVLQGPESNHYAGPIPIEDVRRRLIGWQLQQGTISSCVITEDGADVYEDPNRLSVIRPRGAFGPDDQGEILGTFRRGYRIHQYDEWLLGGLAQILDQSAGELVIESAGLLRRGAVAWVQIAMPETMNVEGVEFRTHITAATSADGTLATGFVAGNQEVVCDNTLHAAWVERDARSIKIRHTSGSLTQIHRVRDALELVYAEADAFSAEIRELVATTVTDRQWAAFLDAHTPVPSKPGAGRTVAEKHRSELSALWATDERVSPWTGTAWGVLQAVNTHRHHLSRVSGGDAKRGERNMANVVKGITAREDLAAIRQLQGVLSA